MSAISKDHQEIGLKIARLREQHGMAQIDLAEELEIGRNTLGHIERGERDFGVSSLISVCDAFDVSPSEVLPDRLKPESGLDVELQRLADRLSTLTPYQRSQCLKAIHSLTEAFCNISK